MEQNLVEKIRKSISNIDEKKLNIYFFVQDTKGNAKASLKYIYDMALSLKKLGYEPTMLHEKPDYTPVSGWLGNDYDGLNHMTIEGGNLQIAPEDFLIIPEIFGFVMDQVKNLPCGKVVLCQAYDHMLETLTPGSTWAQYGFLKCITTSEKTKEYISQTMRNVSIDVIEPTISETFVKQKYPAKPIICIHSREQRDGINMIKQFYLKYPQYRWITFKDMRGLSMNEFSQAMNDAFLGVWIDPTSSFGTFPLECMKSGIPVIGKIPNLTPEWMNDKNGVWVENPIQIVDIVADFIQNWLEDNILPEIYEEGEKTASEYSNVERFESKIEDLFTNLIMKRKVAFEEQINKIEENVEN
jgi:hypothetical protein